MSPLDEPTLGEIIRDIQADLRRLADGQDALVTKAEFEAHVKDAEKRLGALEAKAERFTQWAISSVVAPLVVILVAYGLGMRP